MPHDRGHVPAPGPARGQTTLQGFSNQTGQGDAPNLIISEIFWFVVNVKFHSLTHAFTHLMTCFDDGIYW